MTDLDKIESQVFAKVKAKLEEIKDGDQWITRREIAVKAEVSQTVIYMILRGEMVAFKTLLKVAKALKIELI